MWNELRPIGRHPDSHGYRRYAWTGADADCRAWFEDQARARGLTYETDRNGNQWAWLGDPAQGDAVVTGSHLDSVPDGGAFDGPLGVVSSFAALDELLSRGTELARSLAIVNFGDEEGARFGLACVGSRLTSGALSREQAHLLTDADGVTLPQAMEAAGYDPDAIGADPERLGRIGAFVELHVEQGRGLIDLGAPVGVASSILAHGRWRFTFTGEGNHAGATLLGDRRDPMVPAAEVVLAARIAAAEVDDARATVGRIVPNPGGTNVIASTVDVWLDARADTDADTRRVVARIREMAADAAARENCELAVVEESYGDTVVFDAGLRDAVSAALGGVPALPTGAGHDAGVLAAHVPTAMLFVRNPTGVSHSPHEHADPDDCRRGVEALVRVLEELG
jgi:N-carbamoyl-L-amino-acid hydrolase